jgi:ATP-dependent helicase/nuclease subunit A
VRPSAASARAADAAARLAAQTDFERPLVLEAGAGTGKTGALVARAVGWALGPGWERAEREERRPGEEPEPERVAARALRGVVAITFSEAAAAEMAQRVAEALAKLEKGKAPRGVALDAIACPREALPARAAALRAGLDQLRVSTIHAFCRRLLAEHPLEVGLHPRFEVDADEREQVAAVREVVTESLPEIFARTADALVLARAGQGPREVEETLLLLLRQGIPPAALDADPLEPARVRALVESVVAPLGALVALERGRLVALGRAARKVSGTAAGLAELHARLGALRAADAEGLAELRDWLVESDIALGTVDEWTGDALPARTASALGADAEAFSRHAAALAPHLRRLERLDPRVLAVAQRMLAPLYRTVCERLRARGAVGFAGLLRGARDLLAGSAAVRAAARGEIRQLLVDEFQDTDVLQCEILRWLALDGPPDERPGLFLVGDPKQSIYGWRSADLRAYAGFVAEVEREGGRRMPLVVNHRSAPAILAEVERVIAPVMQPRPGVQPEFQPLLACADKADSPGFVGDDAAPVEHWISWAWDAAERRPVETRSADGNRLEARAVAAEIARLNVAGVAWRRFGLLFRGSRDLETYLVELRRAGVPYAVEGDRGYFQRREVIEAAALVRCILDPHDQLALVTVLRSAAVGVPDAALIPLWAEDLPARASRLRASDPATLEAFRAAALAAAAEVPGDVPGIERVDGWVDNLLAAGRALALLRDSFETDPADVFVEKLRGLLILEVTESARWLGAWRIANLDRFFRDLLDGLCDGERDPQAILRGLRADVAERRESEEGRPKEAIEDAVRVMTIHKAKGLDFDHVYVLQLHKGPGGAEAPHAELVAGRLEAELLGARTLDYDRVQAQRAEVSRAEQVRTLYVAMTRACERLVLAGVHPALAKRADAGSHVALLQKRAELPDLEAAMGSVAGAGEESLDAADARWVFLGLADVAESAPPAPRRALLDPEAVRDGAQALAARRREAEDARARRFHESVSETAHEAWQEERREGRDADEPGEEGATPPRAGGAAGGVAAAVGSAVHRALERMDLAADPDAELARLRAGLEDDLVRALPEREKEEALARADRLLARFAAGELGARLRRLAEHVVARELPVLMPPDAADPDAPAGFLAGRIDLLYRDPDTGEWVVADYKTDALDGDPALDEKAGRYAAQGAGYLRAVREALGLDGAPRFELWFLDADRVVEARPA